MKLTVKNITGKNQGELEVKFPLIENGSGTEAVQQTVVAYRAAQRMGTACTKNVGEVAGTNKKPWRQKATGRARAGLRSGSGPRLWIHVDRWLLGSATCVAPGVLGCASRRVPVSPVRFAGAICGLRRLQQPWGQGFGP